MENTVSKSRSKKGLIAGIAVVVIAAAVILGIWIFNTSNAKAFDEAKSTLNDTLGASVTALAEVDESLDGAFDALSIEGENLESKISAYESEFGETSQSGESSQSGETAKESDEIQLEVDEVIVASAIDARQTLISESEEAQKVYDSTSDEDKNREATDLMNSAGESLYKANEQASENAAALNEEVETSIFDFAVQSYEAAKAQLTSELEAAKKTYKDSENKVADENTRTALADEIENAKTLIAIEPITGESETAQSGEAQSSDQQSGSQSGAANEIWVAADYDTVTKKMNESYEKLKNVTLAVNKSVEAKTEADRIAAEKAEAERLAAEQAAAAQATQNSYNDYNNYTGDSGYNDYSYNQPSTGGGYTPPSTGGGGIAIGGVPGGGVPGGDTNTSKCNIMNGIPNEYC